MDLLRIGHSRAVLTALVLLAACITLISLVVRSRGTDSSTAMGENQTPPAAKESVPNTLSSSIGAPLTTSTATSTPLEPGTGSRLGVWMGGGSSDTVDLVKGTGAKWTRVSLPWSQI